VSCTCRSSEIYVAFVEALKKKERRGQNQCWADITFLDPPVPVIRLFVIHRFRLLLFKNKL